MRLYIGDNREETVPDDVSVIADEIFLDCGNLEILNLPVSVKKVGKQAFASSLKRINYAGTLTDWCSIEFCSAPFESGCELYLGGEKVDSLEIRDMVRIPNFAFAGLKDLACIKIGGDVTTVGQSAFEYCTNVKKIILSESVEKLEKSAFEGCNPSDGYDVDIANKNYAAVKNCLVERETHALIAGCDKGEVEDGIEKIGDYAFTDCKFSSIDLPQSVKEIGDGAFSGSGIRKIELPAKLEKLGDGVFEFCKELTSVTIPASVVSIDKSPFCACDALTYIRVERGNKIYEAEGNCLIEKSSGKCIAGCAESELPSGVTEIDFGAFLYCHGLKSVKLPRGLRKIGAHAFSQTSTREIVFPATLEKIEDFAFGGCKELENITFEGETELTPRAAFCFCDGIKFVTAPKQYKKYYKKIFSQYRNKDGKKPKLKFVK